MRFLKLCAWALGLIVALHGMALAQDMPTSGFPLRGKRVAVYFSKKFFTFDNNYRIPLSQFIKSDEGDNAEIEDIKLQTLVALGTLFSQQLRAPSEADSVYFLNEFPELAQVFMTHYSSDDRTMEAMGSSFAGTDYILVVSPLTLGSYKTSSVYSRSNRIITQQLIIKTAKIRIELFAPQTGARMHAFETCIDERKTHVPKIYFEFHMQSSRTGQFLAKLFSLALYNMNQGTENACDSEELKMENGK